MSNSRECTGVNGEVLQLHAVYKKPSFFTTSHARIRIRYYKSCENPYQVLQVRENPYQVLQVTCAVSECAMKSKVRIIKSLSP